MTLGKLVETYNKWCSFYEETDDERQMQYGFIYRLFCRVKSWMPLGKKV